MDWLLTPATYSAVGALRVELTAFLRRHATDGDQADDAGMVASELISNAVEHAGGPVWVSLDWSAPQPLLTGARSR